MDTPAALNTVPAMPLRGGRSVLPQVVDPLAKPLYYTSAHGDQRLPPSSARSLSANLTLPEGVPARAWVCPAGRRGSLRGITSPCRV